MREADSREFHKMIVALIKTMRRALSAEKELEQLHEISQCGQLAAYRQPEARK